MAQLTRFQGAADEAEVIPAELIEDFIAGYEHAPRVGLGMAWARPGRGNVPVNYPRWDEMSGGVPSAKAETDEFEERDVAMSESSITPALFGFAIKRSDEAMAGSPAGVEAGLLVEALEYLFDDIDAAVLGSITSVASDTGDVTDTYNLARFRADMAAYKLLNLRPGPLGVGLVISPTMADELLTSMYSSSATMVRDEGDTLALGPQAGFLGSLHGVAIYESQTLPASTTGRAGLMAPVGNLASPLGIVVNEMPNVRRTRGDEMERRAADQYIMRTWYGVGVTNPRKGLQCLGAA